MDCAAIIDMKRGEKVYRAYLVDDEPPTLELLTGKPVFAECGFEIVGTSVDPIEAIKMVSAIAPDVVFTDLKMPGLSGIQMMERLKAEGCAAEFVVVSAYGELNDVRRFFTSHGFDYLIKPASDHDLQNILIRLSNKLGSLPLRKDIETPSAELNEILAYLREYSAMRHTLESVGERFGLNPNSICNLFAKHLDTTFIAYLTSLRMKHAEELLLQTDKSVKEIAAVSGYNDYFYFCRVFREQHGCAPTRFREAGGKC